MLLSDQKEFIQDLRARAPGSFTLLYDAYGRKIYNLAFRMTGNPDDAEDITQETFLQVYRHIETYRGTSQIYTWIYAIAKNLCFRFLQRQKRNTFASIEALMDEASEVELPAGITASEKQQLIGQVKDGCLTGLLRCLSFYQRIAFILYVLLRLPLRDVSNILDKSEGATKVLIHRARSNLKLFLCEHCSWYAPANPCQCESLLGFSLKQGWVIRSSRREHAAVPLDLRRIEAEIKSIRAVIDLYSSLEAVKPADTLSCRIQELVRSQDWLILSGPKA